MSFTFAYCRVSRGDLNHDNQKLELERAGYQVDEWVFETISGSVPAFQRPVFKEMLVRVRKGERVLVSRLDRLGRDAIDVVQTIRTLQERGISVVCHQLGNIDLTSPMGEVIVMVLSVVAKMEREALIERTRAGLERAKAEGRVLGPKFKTTDDQRGQIRAELERGDTVSEVARRWKLSRGTIINIRKMGSTSTPVI